MPDVVRGETTSKRRSTASGSIVPKICVSCGRTMEWRKAWAKDWAETKYCSKACKSRKLSAIDHELEATILELLDERSGRGTSICPSEAARRLGGQEWRELMEPTRAAARRLHAAGTAEVMQQGKRVSDPSRTKGPIRIGLATTAAEPERVRNPKRQNR